mmetsp:Transcript_2346/g.3577  ORF Transcript_2346/g.3577 Transcript_2346/m.3577 type:complete len:325 (-) Transcript_2346:46-1020(-)|eukprot:CAMPEP_0195291166 /NCGR_PEP_ID=MMETSP0707-20130614/7258_1 /TAXON_ID=33640 /ORGANISM="Asterionellopsis glacialis, Strain CCMP134" /LENGTH=324 /DNA_ID=CAMNT_0040351429 /DNA_START=173 /DNA_END=1147 /DNA_ORIENTATION=+
MNTTDITDRMKQNNEKHHHNDNDDLSFVLIDPSCAKNNREEETAEVIMDDEKECHNPAKRRKTTTKLKQRRTTTRPSSQKWTLQPRPFIPIMTTTTSASVNRNARTIGWNNNNGDFDNSDYYNTAMKYDNGSYNYNATTSKDKLITPPLPPPPPFDQNSQQQITKYFEINNDGCSCKSPLQIQQEALPMVLTPPPPSSHKNIISSSRPPPVIVATTRDTFDNIDIIDTSMTTPTTSPISMPQQPPKLPFLNLPNLGEGDSFHLHVNKTATTLIPSMKLMLKEQQANQKYKLLPRRPSRHTHYYQKRQHSPYASTNYKGYEFDDQ